MRKDKIVLTHREIAKEKNVEVECARAVLDSRRPVPAKLPFQSEQPFEQLARRQAGFERDNGVDKTGLIRKAHRLGGIERGARGHATQRIQPHGRRRQRGLRLARRAGQVGAESDVRSRHTILTIPKGPAPGWDESPEDSSNAKNPADSA